MWGSGQTRGGGGSCAWCGAPLTVPAVALAGRLPCRDCRAQTTFPWPTESELDEAYGDWYRPARGRFKGPGDALLRRTRAALVRRIDRIAPPGAVVDVGSGEGSLLRALRRRGREAVGLERGAVGPGVTGADITEVKGAFAAVVFWHSLEHLPAPRAALEHAAGLLVPGGVLCVAVPNLDSLQARWFGDRWFALDVPRHLVHLPADTLLAGVRAAGLEVERVSFWRGGQVLFGMLDGLVGRLPGRPSLYSSIRRPEARESAPGGSPRPAVILAGALLLPAAAILAAIEVAVRRGGTVYVEARRPQGPGS